MTRSRHTNRDSHNESDSSEEDSDERSPPRGRTGNGNSQVEEEQVDAQIKAILGENSRASGA